MVLVGLIDFWSSRFRALSSNLVGQFPRICKHSFNKLLIGLTFGNPLPNPSSDLSPVWCQDLHPSEIFKNIYLFLSGILSCGNPSEEVLTTRLPRPTMNVGLCSPARPASSRSSGGRIQDQGDSQPPWRAITQKTPPLPVPDELAHEMSFRVPSPDVSAITLQSDASLRFQQSHLKLPGYHLLSGDQQHSTPTKPGKGQEDYCDKYSSDAHEYTRYNSLNSYRSHMVSSRDDVTSDLGSTLSGGSQGSRRPDNTTTTLGSDSSLSCYHSDGGDPCQSLEAPRNSPTSSRSYESPEEEEYQDPDSTIISEYQDRGRELRPPCVGGDSMTWRMGPVGMPGLVGDRWRHHEDGGIQGSRVSLGAYTPDYGDMYGYDNSTASTLDPRNLVCKPRVPTVPEISMFPSVGSDSDSSRSPSPVKGAVRRRSYHPDVEGITAAMQRQQLMVHYSPVPSKPQQLARHHRGHIHDMAAHQEPVHYSRPHKEYIHEYERQGTLKNRHRRQHIELPPQKLTQQSLKHHTEAMGPVMPQFNVRQALRRYQEAMVETEDQYDQLDAPRHPGDVYETRGKSDGVQVYLTGVPSVSQVFDVYRQQMHYDPNHPPTRQSHPVQYPVPKSTVSSHVYQSLSNIYETIPECREMGEFKRPKNVGTLKRRSGVPGSHYQSAQNIVLSRQAAVAPPCSCNDRYCDQNGAVFQRATELRVSSRSTSRRRPPDPVYSNLPHSHKMEYVIENDEVYSSHHDLDTCRDVPMVAPSERFLQYSQAQGPRYGSQARALNDTVDSDATAFLQKPLIKQHALTRNDPARRSLMKKIQNFGKKMTGRSSGKSSIKTLAVI